MSKKIKNGLKSVSVAVLLLLLWAGVSRAGIFSAYVFPSPLRVWETFLAMVRTGELFGHLLVSILRVLIGFIISCLAAFLFGVFAARYQKAAPFYKPILDFLRHVPPMSLIPLLILWFGIGEAPKMIVIVLTAFFPIFMNTEAGLNGCDPDLLEVGETLHMTKRQIFLHIRIPAAVPDVLVGMQIGLGYSFRAIVGAEMIAAVKGLGYMILDAQALSRTDKVLVGILLIGLFGWGTDALFGWVVRRVNRQMRPQKGGTA